MFDSLNYMVSLKQNCSGGKQMSISSDMWLGLAVLTEGGFYTFILLVKLIQSPHIHRLG